MSSLRNMHACAYISHPLECDILKGRKYQTQLWISQGLRITLCFIFKWFKKRVSQMELDSASLRQIVLTNFSCAWALEHPWLSACLSRLLSLPLWLWQSGGQHQMPYLAIEVMLHPLPRTLSFWKPGRALSESGLSTRLLYSNSAHVCTPLGTPLSKREISFHLHYFWWHHC